MHHLASKFTIKNLHLALTSGEPILQGISLEIPAGQVTSVVGPSGSGKSSLLRCLNRLWEPPPDSIFLDGEDVTALDVLTLRRRVGILFQSPALFDGTVKEACQTCQAYLTGRGEPELKFRPTSARVPQSAN